MKENIKNLTNNYLTVLLLSIVVFSCKRSNEIKYRFIVNEIPKVNETHLEVINENGGTKDFIIKENEIIEVLYFSDIDNTRDTVYLSLTKLFEYEEVNYKDSLGFVSGLSDDNYWGYFKSITNKGDSVYIKRGLGNNYNFEKYIFDKNRKLKYVYFE